jgi:hypothetical protein
MPWGQNRKQREALPAQLVQSIALWLRNKNTEPNIQSSGRIELF